MAEQNPLEEKIKELEERAKHLHEEEVKKGRTKKIEKEHIRHFSEKPAPHLTTQKESPKLSQSSLDLMPSILATTPSFASSEEKPNYDAPWTYKYLRRKYVISMIIIGLIGFLFVANAPYFNKWYQEKKRISSYNSRLHDIRNDIAKKRYDGIEAKVRTLANDLENEKRQQSLFAYKIADKTLEKLEAVRYTKAIRVEARTESVVDKPGHYEQARVEPKYENKTRINKDVLNGVVAKIPLISDVLAPIFKGGLVTEKIKVKEGYYENKWVGPTYKDMVIPAHYQKIEINPLGGKEKVIEDNIPIK